MIYNEVTYYTKDNTWNFRIQIITIFLINNILQTGTMQFLRYSVKYTVNIQSKILKLIMCNQTTFINLENALDKIPSYTLKQ